jgi:hypothetical protein|tara:strand:+ start:119 stop:487 length:369 start_codon:yes stop_codon:yes gene_type:complete
MAFAVGKYAYGVCDRCGFRVKYLQMRMEWTGFKVCPECFEPKHPQLDPPHHVSDPEGLRQARPEVPLPQSQLGLVRTTGPSNTTDSGRNIGGQSLTIVDPIGTVFDSIGATGSVGTVTVVTS